MNRPAGTVIGSLRGELEKVSGLHVETPDAPFLERIDQVAVLLGGSGSVDAHGLP
jgi:hypothetical protein